MNCPICDQTETHFLSCDMPEYLQHIEAAHKEQLQAVQDKYEAAMLKIAEMKKE